MATEAISLTESKRLIQLEKVIKTGEQTFLDVGNALLEIRDSKLYRSDFSSFEEYCAEKWGWSKTHGYRFIVAAETLNSLPEKCHQLVTSESQARALASVPPPKRAKVLEKIVATGKPVTAAAITKAATPPPKRKPAAPVAKIAPVEIHVERDEIGRAIPDAILATWTRRHEVEELLTTLARAKKKISDAMKEEDLLFADTDCQRVLDGVSVALQELKSGKPYVVCPECHGKNIESCGVCKGSGFIGEFYWKHKTTEETRNIILNTLKK